MTVFFFTDIEGSTRLWEEHSRAMGAVIDRHNAILQHQIKAHGGRIFKQTGDGVAAAFEGGEPVACALETQVRMAVEPWGEVGELRIRMGLHAGQAELHAGDYFGLPVNCTARVMSAAWGGQALLTPEVTRISGLPAEASVLDLGEHLLRNVTAPQRILQLLHPELPWRAFPPPRTLSGESIRRAVAEEGVTIAGLAPPSMVVALVSAILVPILQGDLWGESPALAGNLGLLDDLGAVALGGFVAQFAARLQAGQAAGQAPVLSAVRARLEGELLERWEGSDETALALRADASQLLRVVHGLQVAMAAATDDVKAALARGLADLGNQFGEFRWMLAGVQDTLAEMRARQEQQLALQQQHLALTEEILQLQREKGRVAAVPALPESAARPAFLEGDEGPFERPVFVARERELARLDTFLRDARAGSGKVIFVVGGPGGGKTALLNELARRAMDADPSLLVASGSCNAFSGVGDPYLPFREAMGMLSGEVEAPWLAGQITSEHARRLWAAVPLLAQALLAHGPDTLGVFVQGEGLLARAATAGGADAPWLGVLREAVERRQTMLQGAARLGVEQSYLFEQYTNVLRGVSESHPLLLILDDLQWADSTSIGLLFHLGRRLQGAPILIACAYRPEEVALGRNGERHPLEKALAELRRIYGDVTVDLGRENKVEGQRFVEALLDTEPNELGEGFRRALFEHTDGNPLFAIELLRGMQERGDLVWDWRGQWVEGLALDWETLPARVEAVVAERIGRLDETSRAALQVASVEGETFTAEVVAGVQETDEREMLGRLSGELDRRHRLITAQSIVRIDGQLLSRYRFRHILFQKYLYSSLDEVERVHLHEHVGTALEGLYGSREEVAAIAVELARHFQEARITEKAIHYLHQAGDRAVQLSAYQEAIVLLNRGLELVMAQPNSRQRARQELALQISLGMAWKGEIPGPEGEKALIRARELCEQAGKTTQLCRVVGELSIFPYVRAEYHQARELGQEALSLAQLAGDPLLVALAHWHLGCVFFGLGEFAAARAHLQSVISFYEPGQHHHLFLSLCGVDVGASALAYDACCLWCLGYPEQAFRRSQEVLALARELEHAFSLADVLCFGGCLFNKMRRDVQAFKHNAEELVRLSKGMGFSSFLATGTTYWGEALIEMGEIEAGIALMREGMAARDYMGARCHLPGILGALAKAQAKAGQPEEGQATLAKALALVEETDERQWEAELHRQRAELLVLLGDDAEAEASFQKAVDVARGQGGKSWELRATTGLAQVWQKQGKVDEARQMLAEIYGWFAEGFDTPDLQEARALRDALI